MGKSRKFPITKKTNTVGKYRRLRYATSSMQGWRKEMEDNLDVSLSLPGKMKKWAYAGVFDGHGGKKVSAHCSKHLRRRIFRNVNRFKNIGSTKQNVQNSSTIGEEPNIVLHIRAGITKSFLQQDQRMEKSKHIDDDSGSTAVCTLISPTHCYFANCGDSRALLCRNGKVEFVTKDHKPTNSDEKRRILRAGGYVSRMRVNGRLAMSRAMGDFEYKQNRNQSQCSQSVIPKPDVTVLQRNLETDEFVLLACDGIWDVMTNSEVVNFVKNQMLKTEDLKLICNNLLDHCLSKGSSDNMSLVLIKLPGCPKRKVLKQKRKLELAEMHRAIKAKKMKQSGTHNEEQSNTLNIQSDAVANKAQLKPKAKAWPLNAYMRFYQDYLKDILYHVCACLLLLITGIFFLISVLKYGNDYGKLGVRLMALVIGFANSAIYGYLPWKLLKAT
ncbi:unnamed protein product [Orchesella dallaii]|uniref:PPM-type phosphatase domain-containing protein n=1 Tax=Orchesella dallaii TaxID=48710 RepID=A0ABP1PRK9_9HEXA